MFFSSLLEAENAINSLDEENKQKLVTTISFMLINNITQQNNIDEISLIQKMIALIPQDSKSPLVLEINNLVIKHLFKNNIDIFPIIHKLSTVLSDDKKSKIVNDINFLFNNINKNTSNNFNTAPNIVSNTVTRHISQNINHPPPPPPPPLNKTNSFSVSNLNLPQNLNATGTFNLRLNSPTDKENERTIIPIKEALKYLIPSQTDFAKKALSDTSISNDIYRYLKEVNSINPLDQIYLNLYSDYDVINFISRTYSIFNSKYIKIKKDINTPKDKEMKLRVGEWLVVFGYLEEEKLSKIVQLHNIAVRNNEVNNRRFASKTIVNGQPVDLKGPLFGEFLVESEVITKEQLEQALNIQRQYNEILNNLDNASKAYI